MDILQLVTVTRLTTQHGGELKVLASKYPCSASIFFPHTNDLIPIYATKF